MKKLAVLPLLLLAACAIPTPRNSPSPVTTATVTVSPSPTVASSPTPSPATTPIDLTSFNPGPPKELGPGNVVGVTKDGTSAYVTAERPGSTKTGCEGTRAQFLYSVPFDGSERKLAASEDVQPIDGFVRRSPDGARVFVAEYCEEFFQRLLTAREMPDGTLADVARLNVPTDVYQVFNGLQWAPDSKSILGVAVHREGQGTGSPRRDIVRINPDTGEITTVEQNAAVIAVAELSDGSLVRLTPDHKVKLNDREATFEGIGLSVSPDRRRVAAYGPGGVLVVGTGQEPKRVVNDFTYGVEWSSESTGFLHTGRDGVLMISTMDGKTKRISDGAQYGPGYLTAGDRKIVYTYTAPPTDSPTSPTVRLIESTP